MSLTIGIMQAPDRHSQGTSPGPDPGGDGRSAGSEPDPAFRTSVSYIDRSREYYSARGFTVPYRWATNEQSPFSALNQPLSRSTVGVVTTSFPLSQSLDDRIGAGSSGSDEPAPPLTKAVSASASHPLPTEMFTADLYWHKKATHTDDVESFLPLRTLQAMADDGVIGSVGPRFYCVPTEYSKRATAADAAIIEAWCREDGVDAVVLIPL